MNHHIGQTSSNTDIHSDKLQLAVLTQQNKRLLRDILPFEVKHYRHQEELILLPNTAKQFKYHFFAVEQEPLLSSPRSWFLIFVILSQTHIFLLYVTRYLTHYQMHYLNSLTEYGQKYNPWIERAHLENPL